MARSTPAQKPRGWASTTLNIRVISSITPLPRAATPAAERSLPIPATVRAARAMPRRSCSPSRILRLNNPAPILILAFVGQFAITSAGETGSDELSMSLSRRALLWVLPLSTVALRPVFGAAEAGPSRLIEQFYADLLAVMKEAK